MEHSIITDLRFVKRGRGESIKKSAARNNKKESGACENTREETLRLVTI